MSHLKLPDYDLLSIQANKNRLWAQAISHFNYLSTASNINLLLPPPNITGELHLGHAWNSFIQDFLVRYSLLCGDRVCWTAGMDHAGIATEIKVTQNLFQNSGSHSQPPRPKLLQAIKNHRHQAQTTIKNQWKQLGLLIDPLTKKTSVNFTLDPEFQTAVNTIFVQLYHDKLIYEGHRIVMWDMKLKTALSDIEVISELRMQRMYYFRYQAIEPSDHFLIVATSRPETMFVDQALVVNNQDGRFQSWIGRKVINPVTGRSISVIADPAVDPKFGTGVMKCTPGHDQVDFEIGQRHQLTTPICIDVQTGLINSRGGKYAGLNYLVCRRKLVASLKKQGFCLKVESYQTGVPVSQRSQSIVEPILSRQWFVKTRPLADRVQKWQQSNHQTKFAPPRFAQVLDQWMTNVRDWCISRQINWGHRLPVWKNKTNNKDVYVGVKPPLNQNQMEQIPDVFDTWFSSALCPLVASGWPKTPAQQCRSITLLVTGYDIIFFWVARMLMFNLYVTNRALITTVLVHGLVRDATGRKMSKSLNNGINPLTVIKEYGVDGLRLFLLTNTTPGLDLKFNLIKIRAGVSFIYKLWNTAQYVIKRNPKLKFWDRSEIKKLIQNQTKTAERTWHQWITEVWDRVEARFHQHIHRLFEGVQAEDQEKRCEYGIAFNDIKRRLIHDFCDWYLEFSKTELGQTSVTSKVLGFCFLRCLLLLHPFIPFVSEYLFDLLLNTKKSILNQRFSCTSFQFGRHNKFIPGSSENNYWFIVTLVQQVIRELRAWKTLVQFSPREKICFRIIFTYPFSEMVSNETLILMNPVFKKMVNAHFDSQLTPSESEKAIISFQSGQILLSAQQSINPAQVLKAIQKKRQRIEFLLNQTQKMLKNQNFINKANPEKVDEMRKRLVSLQTQHQQLKTEFKKYQIS